MNKLPGRVCSTLEVVEDFYGEQLSSSLYKRIRQTPFYQLSELADRIATNSKATIDVLSRRGTRRSPDEPPLFVHDTTYLQGGQDTPLTEVPELKHLILHAERFILPDTAADWARFISEQESGEYISDGTWQEFINGLVQYMRMVEFLLPLIKLGSIVLLPSKEELRISDWHSGALTAYGDSLLGTESMWYTDPLESFALDDPYIAWALVNKLKPVDDWEYATQGFDATELLNAADYIAHQAEYYPHIKEALYKLVDVAYGDIVRPEQVRDAVQVNLLSTALGATPIISTPVVRNHLLNSAAVVLEGNNATVRKDDQALEAAVTYRIPSLAAVSHADLMKLRLNEDIYYEVRSCLESLALGLAAPNMPASFAAYEREVREQAEDIVRPVYEKLSAKLKREKALSLVAGYGIGGLVSLGINGLAVLTHGAAQIAVRSTGNTANNLGKRFGQRTLGRNQNDLSTACSILVSLLEDQ